MQTLSMVMLVDTERAITIMRGDIAQHPSIRTDLWSYRTMDTVVTTVFKVAMVTVELATLPTVPTERSLQFHRCH
jgi:hypothetical protein